MKTLISNSILNLEKNLLEELNQCSVHNYQRGQVIIRQSSYVKHLPLLLCGSIRVFRQTEERQILYYYLQKGDICGLSLGALLQNKPLTSEIAAAEFCSILHIPANKVFEWQKSYVSWNEFIIRTFSLRQQQLLESYGEMAFSKMEKRIKDYLCYLLRGGNATSIVITHQQLANELGTTRVVISRILKSMESEGSLELVRGSIRIKKLQCSL